MQPQAEMPQFHYPATELFDLDGQRLVVFSQQEFEKALQDGYVSEPPQPTEPPKSGKRGK